MPDSPNLMSRRSAIKRAVALFGGTLTSVELGLLTDAVAALTEGAEPRFLDGYQLEMLETIVDLMIPDTDTPGARAAGAHHFIDLMLAEWASPGRQARYVAGLDDIDNRARESAADGFAASPKDRQLALLQALDKEAFASDSGDTFFRELKKMVLFAYYSSEIGATVELRFQRLPGDYRSCVPMDQVGRAWFWNGYSYEL